MAEKHHESLRRCFPKTLIELEERFGTDEACRAYLAVFRCNGPPRSHDCDSDDVWTEHGDTLYECARYSHQTSPRNH